MIHWQFFYSLQSYISCISDFSFFPFSFFPPFLTNSWRFIVHGGIDGFGRVIVYLSAATNNRASTVLESFIGAVQKFGLPSCVRSDKGENVDVALFMVQCRGEDRNSHITGRSVHNQRSVFSSTVL